MYYSYIFVRGGNKLWNKLFTLRKVQLTTKINCQSTSLLKHGRLVLIKNPSLPADMQHASDASLRVSILGAIAYHKDSHYTPIYWAETVSMMFPIFNMKILLQK